MLKLLYITLFLSLPFTAMARDIAGAARVIDGDTLHIQDVRIRLHGIDAPEMGQICKNTREQLDCGAKVTQALYDWLGQRAVQCQGVTTDRYGRVVAKCFVNGQDIGESLVRAGLAFAYAKYSTDYLAAEQEAMQEKRGLHALQIDRPEAYRRGAGTVVDVQNVQNNCRIKGNISRNGKIYHMPGQSYYSRTKINESKGERWFCSEAEAKAAGWRRSKR